MVGKGERGNERERTCFSKGFWVLFSDNQGNIKDVGNGSLGVEEGREVTRERGKGKRKGKGKGKGERGKGKGERGKGKGERGKGKGERGKGKGERGKGKGERGKGKGEREGKPFCLRCR